MLIKLLMRRCIVSKLEEKKINEEDIVAIAMATVYRFSAINNQRNQL